MKICRKCKKEKEFDQYHKWKAGEDGLCLYCKGCVGLDRKKYLEKNRCEINRKRKEQRKNDPERFKRINKLTYERYRDKYIEKQRKYNAENREKINESQRKYNLIHKDERNAKERAFLATEEGKLRSNEYYQKTKERFDIKIKARNKLRYAVRVGKILKPEYCETCFKKTKLDGHHNDYNKPLEIIWVCNHCHKKIHKT